MDLLKMVAELVELKEKVRQTEYNLMEKLRNLFVNLQFEMKQEKIQEWSGWGTPEEKLEKVYYPVLEVPKGFVKEDEKYVRNCANALNHTYILKDEAGTEVYINEYAVYRWHISNSNGVIRLPSNMVEFVTYKITICSETYKFKREFEYEDMLQKISKGKIDRTSISSKEYYKYTLVNQKYEDLLRYLGVDKPIISLGEILTSKTSEIKLRDQLVAKYECENRVIKNSCWYESSTWSFRFDKVPFVETTINVEIYYHGNMLLKKQKYTWVEIQDPKFKKGFTFKEAIELIKQ